MKEPANAKKMLDSIVSHIPDIVYRLDQDGCITFINKAVERYGYRIKDLIGMPILDWVHPEDRQMAAYRVNERRTGDRRTQALEVRLNKNIQGEYPLDVLDNGPVFAVTAEGIYKSPRATADGFVGTQGIARKISQKKGHIAHLQKRIHDLTKQIWEYEGHNKIKRLFENSDIPIDQILRAVAGLLPQYSRILGITSARIQFGEITCTTEDFHESDWKLDTHIVINHEKRGIVELFYTHDITHSYGKKDLLEEKMFFEALVKRLSTSLERIEAETYHRRQSQFLNSVLESLPYPFYVINVSDYRITLANTAAQLGRLSNLSTCHALTHNRDMPCETDDHPCPVEIIKRTKQPVTVEHYHYDKNGMSRLFEINAYPVFDPEGNVSQIIESSVDITSRKKMEVDLKDSEMKFRAVAQSAHDAIVSSDSESTIVFWNRSAEEMFGYSEDEILGQPITILMPDRFKEAHIDSMKRHVSNGESQVLSKTIELVGLRKDGQEFPLELSLAAWKVGEESFYTGIIRDISKRKRVEEEREKMISDLQDALSKVKTLSGLLPICASCKKVRDDKGYWNQIETYIHEHSGADFSHGICPECAQKLYPELHTIKAPKTNGVKTA